MCGCVGGCVCVGGVWSVFVCVKINVISKFIDSVYPDIMRSLRITNINENINTNLNFLLKTIVMLR